MNVRVVLFQQSASMLQIFDEDSDESMNDSYWTYRAEAVPEEELNLKEGEQILFLCHVSMKKEDKRVRHSSYSSWLASIILCNLKSLVLTISEAFLPCPCALLRETVVDMQMG